MKKRMSAPIFQGLFTTFYVMSDVIMSLASFTAAFFIRFYIVSPGIALPSREHYLALSLLYTLLNLYFLSTTGLYRPMRGLSLIDIVFKIIKSTSLSLVILLALSFFYREFEYSRLTILYAALASYLLISVGRAFIQYAERYLLTRGYGQKKVLIIGTGGQFPTVGKKFVNRKYLGYELLGYVEETGSSKLAEIPLLGTLDELEKLIVTLEVNAVVVTLAAEHHSRMKEIVDLCDRRGVECLLVPDMVELLVGPRFYEEICGVPLIRVKGLRIRGVNAFLKRAMDLALGLTGLMFLAPFLFIISAMIRRDSPGPIFYMQKRVGMDGKIFWMYKFRSMRSDAEAENGPGWPKDGDTRVTKFGAFLRKFSIDELPQILNVIKGEMSLIGPRPERPYFVEKFEQGIPRYMERHKVKSGMSGWAQVNGLRGDTSIPERLQFDLYYIENWSILFDFKIIILTIIDHMSNFKISSKH
ncbi:MAG TPA: undecaprenyl-phosphate glucose phosphotransferase [bacterium]|nr:undecaprenyl-phosphate glucose phosphotransferase [bacterium]